MTSYHQTSLLALASLVNRLSLTHVSIIMTKQLYFSFICSQYLFTKRNSLCSCSLANSSLASLCRFGILAVFFGLCDFRLFLCSSSLIVRFVTLFPDALRCSCSCSRGTRGFRLYCDLIFLLILEKSFSQHLFV